MIKDISKYLLKNSSSIKEALIALDKISGGAQTLIVINNEAKVIGTVTDGDIRRALIRGRDINDEIESVFQRNFKFTYSESVDLEYIKKIRSSKIQLLPILKKDGTLCNLLDLSKQKSILPIDAVLMAGGKGERLRPLTEHTPKPLLPINGRPIIDYNIERLIQYGINHISVTVNYLKEQIEDHFANEVSEGVRINCVREPEFFGTIGSLRLVKKFYNDTVLLMNSDLFTDVNYEDFYLHFKKNDADMSVAVVPYSVNVPYGIFELDGRTIKSIKEKPTYNYYANAGIYLIKQSLIDMVPDDTFYNATDLIDQLIKDNRKVIRFPLSGYWIDIGKKEDYIKAQELSKHISS